MKKLKKPKWLQFPLIYCWRCRKCVNRCNEWKNLFDTDYFVRCTDVNGTHIRTIIPRLLWVVDWCKLYYKKEK